MADHATIDRLIRERDEARAELDRLRAALSAPAPALAEPVAWLQSYTDQGHTYKRLFLVSEFPDMGGRQLAPGVTVVPLYAAPAAPAGWQLVPKEATPEMLRAAITAWVHSAATRGTSADNPKSAGHRAWSAALAAAPGAQGGA